MDTCSDLNCNPLFGIFDVGQIVTTSHGVPSKFQAHARLDFLPSSAFSNKSRDCKRIKISTTVSQLFHAMAFHDDTKQMLSLQSPPFVSISGIPNFRDLGGYAVSPNLAIRRNLVYRCGEPSKVTQEGIETLKSLGITHMYDLRSKVEIDRNKDAGLGGIKEWDGCERVFAPVFIDQDYSPENLALRLKDYASDGTGVMP